MATTAAASAAARNSTARSNKKLVAFVFFALLTLFVTAGKNQDVFTDPASKMMAHYRPALPFLIPHAFFAAIALFTALFQFSTRLRTRYLTFHRRLGYVYIACTFIGAPLGIAISLYAPTMGLLPASIVQAFGWTFCTGMALYCVRNGNISEHRRWMIRGYAFAMVFTVARAIIPLPPVLKMGELGVNVTVWTVLALAGFLPTLFLDWPKIRKASA